MTTVVWDGQTLAVDTQTTVSSIRGADNCNQCGKNSNHREFNDSKLTVGYPKTSKFRGEQVLATAALGDHEFCVTLVAQLKQGRDIELQIKSAEQLDLLGNVQAALVILTELDIWEFDINTGTLEVICHDDKPLALGSGRSLARMALNDLSGSAVGIIEAAIKHDDYTGGDVMWTTRELAANHVANKHLVEHKER